jgi:DNA-binding XRE family transcriptional regulator
MRPPTKFLIAARLMLDQTQAMLADAAGLSTRTVHNLEHGDAKIESVETLVKYFKSRGISFAPPSAAHGWTIRNDNVLESFDDERQRVKEAKDAETSKKESNP